MMSKEKHLRRDAVDLVTVLPGTDDTDNSHNLLVNIL